MAVVRPNDEFLTVAPVPLSIFTAAPRVKPPRARLAIVALALIVNPSTAAFAASGEPFLAIVIPDPFTATRDDEVERSSVVGDNRRLPSITSGFVSTGSCWVRKIGAVSVEENNSASLVGLAALLCAKSIMLPSVPPVAFVPDVADTTYDTVFVEFAVLIRVFRFAVSSTSVRAVAPTAPLVNLKTLPALLVPSVTRVRDPTGYSSAVSESAARVNVHFDPLPPSVVTT